MHAIQRTKSEKRTCPLYNTSTDARGLYSSQSKASQGGSSSNSMQHGVGGGVGGGAKQQSGMAGVICTAVHRHACMHARYRTNGA